MPEQETFVDMSFAKGGIDLSAAVWKQPPHVNPTNQQEYFRSTPVAVNVRAYEAGQDRARGGTRAGLKRYVAQPVIAGWILQDLDQIVGNVNPGGSVQINSSGRVVTIVAVSQGQVYIANAGDTSWTLATNNTGQNPPLNFTGLVYSAPNNQKLYFADGTNWCYYVPVTNSVERWTPGTTDKDGNTIVSVLPVDSAGNKPRLICTWRGRIVLSGLLLDPQNWFMSAITDPNNFDYSPTSTTPTQAVAGNNSPLGTVGDVVTTLIPYTDDVLIFGGDHTIWMMKGDPMGGGQLDLVSDTIGMAWGIPWCKDPYGTVYFVSNKTGIYTLIPGQSPVRISQAIEQLIAELDTGANTIRMIWDDRNQGCHVFITPTAQAVSLANAGTVKHLFYEQRTGGWFQDNFANPQHNPLTVCTFDGNLPGDRVPLIGSWDGYVRSIDPEVSTDDGWPITSEVLIGPILSKDMDTILLKDLQGVLGETSGEVTWEVLVGPTAEIAISQPAVESGTWEAGRNLSSFVRSADHAIWVRISSTNAWSLEQIRARVALTGKVRRRGP